MYDYKLIIGMKKKHIQCRECFDNGLFSLGRTFWESEGWFNSWRMSGRQAGIRSEQGLQSHICWIFGYHYCLFTFLQLLYPIWTLHKLYFLPWKIYPRQKEAYLCYILKNEIVYLTFSRNIHFLAWIQIFF